MDNYRQARAQAIANLVQKQQLIEIYRDNLFNLTETIQLYGDIRSAPLDVRNKFSKTSRRILELDKEIRIIAAELGVDPD